LIDPATPRLRRGRQETRRGGIEFRMQKEKDKKGWGNLLLKKVAVWVELGASKN